MIKMYDNIEAKTLNGLVNIANIRILRMNNEADKEYLRSMDHRINALAGLTDYKDHREDTPTEVIKQLKKSIKNRLLQNGNYYSSNEDPFDTIVIKLSMGSWGAYAMWSNGSTPHFK